ncbi:MAG: hypothetical protein AUG84_02135 [Chloroflexi bacterium 13_1_20CM_4_66_7]|nr:MAG: hypothetical protein AUG84_02135 [Chloroflexi bacterium 13_1_20CM_4_66_7]
MPTRYYLLEQDLLVPGASALGDLPEDMDPLDWVQGKVMPPPPNPLRLVLSENSGDFRGDIIESLLTLYSDKLKHALTDFGVDNVDYFPVELEHPETRRIEVGYWLANVIGLVNCVDLANSTFQQRSSGTGIILESFTIDDTRAPHQPIFRLDEKATLVVINEHLKAHLDAAGLAGVRFTRTEEYGGD